MSAVLAVGTVILMAMGLIWALMREPQRQQAWMPTIADALALMLAIALALGSVF